MAEFPLGTKVKNMETGQIGVAVRDLYGCCTTDEVPVVYEGELGFLGTDHVLLENLGPENAIADLQKCGAGKGADCCIFLTAGAGGACCERFSSLRDSLICKDMTAKRQPTELWPDCMNQDTAEG